jgi:hypothetical protein
MRKFFFIYPLIIVLLHFYGCSKSEDSPNAENPPTIQLTATKIHTIQGRKILMAGIVTDAVGIESINLKNTGWYLDKTIVVNRDSVRKTYQLSYSFAVPSTAANTEQSILITVTNIGGKTTTAEVKVDMDGDFVAPTISFAGNVVDGAVLVPGPSDKFNINFTISDNRRLDYLVIKEATLGLNDSIPSLTGKTYNYVKTSIAIPQTKASYTFNIAFADTAGNKVTKQVNVQVNISWDFEKMYLSDVTTKDQLTSDLFGVPMLVDKTAAFTYEAKYFCETAGTVIKFLAQKSDFGPHCFGVNPNNSAKLVNDVNASGIVLSQKGYYKITFSTNPDNLSYTVTKFDPMTDPNRPDLFTTNNSVDPGNGYIGVLGLVGTGFADCPNMNWSPAQIANYPDLQLKQDATYQYRWTTNVALNGNVQFIIGPEHPWNWWPEPYWRFNSKSDPEYTILKGGNNVDLNVSTKTTYKLVWDQYLNRAKMIIVN